MFEPLEKKCEISDFDYNNIMANKYFREYIMSKGYKTTKKVGKKSIETAVFPPKDKFMELSASFLAKYILEVKANEKEEKRKIIILVFLFVALGIGLGILLCWAFLVEHVYDIFISLF